MHACATHTYLYIYIHIHIHVYIYAYVHTCITMVTCTRIYMCLYIYIYIYICGRVCVCVYVQKYEFKNTSSIDNSSNEAFRAWTALKHDYNEVLPLSLYRLRSDSMGSPVLLLRRRRKSDTKTEITRPRP